jgi:hypothetical protein
MKDKELRPPRMKPASRSGGVGWLLVVIAIILGASALLHTVTRNKTVAIGRQQADMEREIATLDVSIRAVEISIEEALSRKNLTDRLAAQRTKLRNITPDDIVPIQAAAAQ